MEANIVGHFFFPPFIVHLSNSLRGQMGRSFESRQSMIEGTGCIVAKSVFDSGNLFFEAEFS